ncbi:MAG: 3-oxoacyl-ACP synthase [Desulfobulbaceae bacterium]|nr:3-oxoacyl-ACP synthase [Desulfobulbaceae bacterium]
MSGPRVFIGGVGIVSALGDGPEATEAALRHGASCLGPLTLFPLVQGRQLPAGQAAFRGSSASPLPRTHQLALHAAEQALAGGTLAPDAVVLGCTTGGMLRTEDLLARKVIDASAYRFHGLHTVAAEVARLAQCQGPALTVSTACSSGALALALAFRLLKNGRFKRVLAGGVDSLCRLTFFGFHSLQLVDASGPKPMDQRRRGMAVAEGAAMLFLSTEEQSKPLAELLGAGLSCDAHHPASPHPQGDGALAAMQAALTDAGLPAADIDYISLHGTGTTENDLAEAQAIRRLFTQPPPLSSIKGASGHSLAAAGAIEAVVASLALAKDFVPGNTGFAEADPALGLTPQLKLDNKPLRAILSNSFGFGGNNGSLLFAAPSAFPAAASLPPMPELAVHGCACLTGAGNLQDTMARLQSGASCAGLVNEVECCAALPARQIRRLKRLARLSLALAAASVPEDSGQDASTSVESVFMGTGWGALSETADFLTRLEESGQQFPSPTDFIGSVHNSPAGQIALMLGAKGANVTTSGGSQSFEQACFAAELLACREGQAALLLGADEGHAAWSPMLDSSISPETSLSDGGAALYLRREHQGAWAVIRHCLLYTDPGAVPLLIEELGGAVALSQRIGLIMAAVSPLAEGAGQEQLAQFRRHCGRDFPLCFYQSYLGQFASASAVAAALAVAFVHEQEVPALLLGQQAPLPLAGKNILLLSCGTNLSAMEFSLP